MQLIGLKSRVKDTFYRACMSLFQSMCAAGLSKSKTTKIVFTWFVVCVYCWSLSVSGRVRRPRCLESPSGVQWQRQSACWWCVWSTWASLRCGLGPTIPPPNHFTAFFFVSTKRCKKAEILIIDFWSIKCQNKPCSGNATVEKEKQSEKLDPLRNFWVA